MVETGVDRVYVPAYSKEVSLVKVVYFRNVKMNKPPYAVIRYFFF